MTGYFTGIELASKSGVYRIYEWNVALNNAFKIGVYRYNYYALFLRQTVNYCSQLKHYRVDNYWPIPEEYYWNYEVMWLFNNAQLIPWGQRFQSAFPKSLMIAIIYTIVKLKGFRNIQNDNT